MASNIIRRRVQKLGGSSLVITLPKSWVKKTGISVGDSVIVVDEGDYLKVYPSKLVSGRPMKSLYVRNNAGVMSRIDFAKLAECAYVNGYGRITLESPRHLAERIMDQIARSGRVKQVTIQEGRVEIELSDIGEVSEGALVHALKTYMQSLHRILDYLEEAGKYGDLREDIDGLVETSVDSAIRIARIAGKSGEGECSPSLHAMVGMMMLVPKMLRHVAGDVMQYWDDRVAQVVNMIRWGLVEALGGLSSGSAKRLEEAAKKAHQLREEAGNLDDPHLHGIRVAALAITDVIESIATLALCRVAEEYSQ